MKVIAGLGNPGERYANTPHNVGFDVVDLIAQRLGTGWKNSTRFHARVARSRVAGETVLLTKPQTFMNLSGTSVSPLLRYHGAGPEDLTVVLDDADLPMGTLRIRASGSSGGHRGLQSVIEALGTSAFPRVRLGVGRDRQQPELADQVLGTFDDDQASCARQLVETAADAVLWMTEKGLNEAMNRFNGRQADATLPTDRM